MDWSRLFPPVDETYQGPRIPFYFLIVITVVNTGRSLVHLFAADGGAGIIAGIPVDVEGGANIIAIFGQWGASQLILALITWLVILRYRFLVPAMLGVVALEQALRVLAGQLKPLQVTEAPPGAFSLYLLPVAIVFFLWSLWRKR